ncbi:MAG: hypothetical protein OXC46_05490 [Thaumarchaeota archaeon]|nr:hypothetical protein [Nitrososphaerota archaeon]
MADQLKTRLEKLRGISDSARRRASLYADIAKINSQATSNSLGALQKAPAPGKKLQKIGFIMLWIPEPTGVTCALGGPMIVAGRYLDKKYNGATIRDVAHQTNSTISSISDFKSKVL